LKQPDFKKVFARWRDSLEKYIEEAMGINPSNGFSMSTQQRNAAREVSKLVNAKRAKALGKKLTPEEEEYAGKLGLSIMSGQGTGKDAFTSWVMDWWLNMFDETLIPCTAPTADQIKNILWSEFSRWYNKTKPDGTPFHVFKSSDGKSDGLVVESQKIWVRETGGKENFAFWKTANPKDDPESQAGTLYGFHAPYMLIVVDEAASVPQPVFKPLEGTITSAKGVNWILLIFNPIHQSGYAVDSHFGMHKEKWIRLHWDAEESENVSPQHIQDMEEKYGRKSNTFRTLVKGLPPLAEEDSVIPNDWIQNAIDRELVIADDDPIIMGLDPGAGGDNTVACIRQGWRVKSFHKFSSPDTMEVVAWAAELMEQEEVTACFVDIIGIGNGVYYRLKELGYRVFPVDVRIKSSDEKFRNIRAELWWKAREVFEKNLVSMPNDLFFKDELSAPRFIHKGKTVEVDSKAEIKKKLSRSNSPNHADAFNLTLTYKDAMFRRQKKDAYSFDKYKHETYGGEYGWMVA
jgi:phage terminase large subunit